MNDILIFIVGILFGFSSGFVICAVLFSIINGGGNNNY